DRLELLPAKAAIAIRDGEDHLALASRATDGLEGNRASQLLNDERLGVGIEDDDQLVGPEAIGGPLANDRRALTHVVVGVDDEAWSDRLPIGPIRTIGDSHPQSPACEVSAVDVGHAGEGG